MVELFAQTEGMDWTICFDGKKSREIGVEDPHLAFSGSEGADALMERLAYEAKERGQLVCVTNDSVLRNFLFGLGVSVVSVAEFEKQLKRVEKTFGFS